MSLFHSRPVAVQRVYYKPSAMDRLKALFTPRHHQHVSRPRTTAAPRRTLGRKKVVRQPVRKTGFFHRSSPRRTVVATQRRPGFFASLRPHHARRTRVTPAPAPAFHGRRHQYRGHNKHHKGSTMAAVIAALSLKKHSHKRYRY